MEDKPFRVLIIATGNGGCRSQMLAGWLRWFGGEKIFVEVGADKPGKRDSLAIRAMADVGLDIKGERVAPMIKFLDDPWDVVILMRNPKEHKKPRVTATKQMIYYEFPNPDKKTKNEEKAMINYRNVRDDIHDWARTFCERTVGLLRGDTSADLDVPQDVSG